MILRSLDTRGLLAENAAFDSFACGFRLALELADESQQYHKERPEEALAVLRLSKKPVIASQSADWLGNPLLK